jgi:hypothetical protein
MAEELSTTLHTPMRARVLFLMVIKHFKCDPEALLYTFLDNLLEIEWQGAAARDHIIADLHHRLLAEQSSIADFGLEPPPEDRSSAEPMRTTCSPPSCLEPDQRAIFDFVTEHLAAESPPACALVHVEGEPGGGKSFLLEVILSHARSIPRPCLPAAFPAKVARKFPGGQTAHFWLGLAPSNAGDDVTLHAECPSSDSAYDTKQQHVGRRLRDARLIFVDEVTMMRADELDAVVAKLHELSFRGVFMIVGNCAQLGPVIPGADDATTVEAAIVNAVSFPSFRHFRLTGQRRMTDVELRAAVHAVGYGTWPSVDGGSHSTCAAQRIRLPVSMFPAVSTSDSGLEHFQRWVHGDVAAQRPDRLQGVIVCSTNARADEHNLAFLDRMDGSMKTYGSRDEVVPVRDGAQAFESAHISSDAARAFNQPGIPPAELSLKVGAPVYVALNLDRTEGLVKGALAVVQRMLGRTVVVRLCQPENPSRAIWTLPRVCFEFQPDKLPVKIQRFQIPLRLAWAVTVHRVIGDDLNRVGVDLRDPYFAHGQLHVSCSRGHTRQQTLYFVDERDFHGDSFETINVVEPRMLFDEDLG